jgi:acyl-homoserine-lactone acylase
LPWSTTTAFTLADANSGNFRFLNTLLATDEAASVPAELRVLKKYQGLPWMDLLAADSVGHACMPTSGRSPASATRIWPAATPCWWRPYSSGPACRSWTAPGRHAPWGRTRLSRTGHLGPAEEPVLQRSDFVENSNDSYWMTNPA